jgi:NADH-quinone oxidoreductase subunit L
MNLHQFPSIILLSVFIGTFFAGSVGLRSPARWSQGITIIGVGLSCLLSWILFLSGFGLTQAEHLYCFSWLSYSGLDMHWGYLIDPLTLIMMLVVTTISLLVHLYSIGYMKDDYVMALSQKE